MLNYAPNKIGLQYWSPILSVCGTFCQGTTNAWHAHDINVLGLISFVGTPWYGTVTSCHGMWMDRKKWTLNSPGNTVFSVREHKTRCGKES